MYDYDRTAKSVNSKTASLIRLGRLQKRDIKTVLDSAGVKYSEFSHDGGGFEGRGWTIYWDDQDSSNEGWAYRKRNDSGELDSTRDVEKVVKKLAAYRAATSERIAANEASFEDLPTAVQAWVSTLGLKVHKVWKSGPDYSIDFLYRFPIPRLSGDLVRKLSKYRGLRWVEVNSGLSVGV